MELNIGERFRLVELLPKEGDRLTVKVVKDMLDKLNPNSEEILKYGIKMVDAGNGRQQIVWDKQDTANIAFNTVELDILKRKVDELEKEKKISVELLPLLERMGI